MKMDKNRKEEYKIARSEERVAARNARKEDKAKYKASLVAFKKTYVRKTSTTKASLAA